MQAGKIGHVTIPTTTGSIGNAKIPLPALMGYQSTAGNVHHTRQVPTEVRNQRAAIALQHDPVQRTGRSTLAL